jgi:acetyl esterase
MSDETKFFVTNLLKMGSPRNTPKIDVHVTRQARAQNAVNTIAQTNLDGLVTKKFTIPNTVDNYEIPVTLFTPQGARENSPITVFYHGGGWTFGTVDTHFHAVVNMANATKTVWLSVEYRLAPEHKFPVLLNDCRSVLEWAAKNKSTLSSESAKLGVFGDSAGGQLAAVMAHEYKSLLDFQLLVYPVVDMSNSYPSAGEFVRDCYVLVPEVMEFFSRNVFADEAELTTPEASPLNYKNFKELPRCLIILAELDPLFDSGRTYGEKLRENGIECELKTIKGVIHAYFSNGIIFKNGFGETVGHIVDFLKTI